MKRLAFLFLLFAVTVGAVHAEGWTTVEVDHGRFRVSFPTGPAPASFEIETVFGRATLIVFGADAGETACFVGYYDIPANVKFSEAELLDAERDRGLKGASASLLRDGPFISAGYSGRMIVAQREHLRVRTRNLIVGQRLYSLIAVGQMEGDLETTANRFFDSFAVWLPEGRRE